ncbi:MAG: hypothetical protein ABIG61_12210 [Planctomycetota bacterium]
MEQLKEGSTMPPESQPLAEAITPAISRRLDDMNSKRKAWVIKRASDTPETLQRSYLKAACKLGSPRSAIKAFCIMCCGWQRGEVAQCTSWNCPLWAWRPFQNGAKDA